MADGGLKKGSEEGGRGLLHQFRKEGPYTQAAWKVARRYVCDKQADDVVFTGRAERVKP